MKMYKMTVYILDFEDVGIETAKADIQDCTDHAWIRAFEEDTTDIGEWYNEHPVNQNSATQEVLDSYFEVLPSFKDLVQAQFDSVPGPCSMVVAVKDGEDLRAKMYAVTDVDEFVENMEVNFNYLYPTHDGSAVPVIERKTDG